MRPRRVERLDDASASFFVFSSQDGIFMARAVEDVTVVHAGVTRAWPAYKALGGHRPRRA
jgi:hypothetical protein